MDAAIGLLIGGGDIKLLAMIGAFFGSKSLIFILLFSSLMGAVIGIAEMMIQKLDMKYAIRFKSFLSAAAVAYLFFGDAFMQFLIFGSYN
jgi:leader peptidase (prepilin peptidase)/N-methyltransferase